MSDDEGEDAAPLPQKKSSSNQESTHKSLLPITRVIMYFFLSDTITEKLKNKEFVERLRSEIFPLYAVTRADMLQRKDRRLLWIF